MIACAAGQHTLTITKLTDSKKGVAWLQSIELGPAGAFLPPPPTPGMRSGRRMLFIGDSFTSGSGNTGNAQCPRMAANQNALLAYGPFTAAHFQADFQVTAVGGAGLVARPRRWGTWAPPGSCLALQHQQRPPSPRFLP